jgi:hypothetical protein
MQHLGIEPSAFHLHETPKSHLGDQCCDIMDGG